MAVGAVEPAPLATPIDPSAAAAVQPILSQLAATKAPAGAKPLAGIYSLEGGRLKMCFASPGKDRPTEFSSKEDSGNVLTEWEHEKKD